TPTSPWPALPKPAARISNGERRRSPAGWPQPLAVSARPSRCPGWASGLGGSAGGLGGTPRRGRRVLGGRSGPRLSGVVQSVRPPALARRDLRLEDLQRPRLRRRGRGRFPFPREEGGEGGEEVLQV